MLFIYSRARKFPLGNKFMFLQSETEDQGKLLLICVFRSEVRMAKVVGAMKKRSVGHFASWSARSSELRTQRLAAAR